MNTCDPFNLRRTTSGGQILGILQSNAQRNPEPTIRGRQTASEVTEANMSNYYAPSQNFQDGPTHRQPQLQQTQQWQSAQSRYSDPHEHSNGGISEKFNEFFGSDRGESLPMYKDKPRGAYPGSSRRKKWWQRRRTVGGVLVVFAVMSWWFGMLSPLSWFTRGEPDESQRKSASERKGSWFGIGRTVDWDERADRVKEVFKTSFKGYEQHAWGMCRVWLPLPVMLGRKSVLMQESRLRRISSHEQR